MNEHKQTVAEFLGLTNDWTVTRFPCSWELQNTDGRKTSIPVPYSVQSKEWWEQAALKAIQNS